MNPFIYILLAGGLILVMGMAYYAYRRLSKNWSFHHLFKDFNRKIWMTISLGGLFLFLYLLLIGFSLYLVKQAKIDLFSLFYHYPVDFIYGGLALFACISLSIYLARMVIKYVYLTRGKDS